MKEEEYDSFDDYLEVSVCRTCVSSPFRATVAALPVKSRKHFLVTAIVALWIISED